MRLVVIYNAEVMAKEIYEISNKTVPLKKLKKAPTLGEFFKLLLQAGVNEEIAHSILKKNSKVETINPVHTISNKEIKIPLTVISDLDVGRN